jgi:hypothetical protein
VILLGEAAGRWLEPAGDRRPRGMVAREPARRPTESGLQADFALLPVRGSRLPKSIGDGAPIKTFIVAAATYDGLPALVRLHFQSACYLLLFERLYLCKICMEYRR